MRYRGALILLFLAAWTVSAVADEWPAPRVQHVFSPNSQHFVRIVPDTGNRAAAEPATTTARNARGEFYLREPDRSYRLVADVALQNPVSPTYAIVTDEGYFVTFDDWFQKGDRNVMVFYRPTGALIRTLMIEDIYKPEALAAIPKSKSSLHWQCGVFYTPPQGANGDSLTVRDHAGGGFILDAKTGTFEYRPKVGAGCSPGTAPMLW